MKARFAGVCACCGTAFRVGEEIVQDQVDGGIGWVLENHVFLPPVEATPDICPKCHTAKSLSGACMCEE